MPPTVWEGIKRYRTVLTIILAAAGIGAMVLYTYCDTTCSSLRGDIFGIDLKDIGPGYMIVLAVLAVFRQSDYLRLLLAAGVGVEVYLFVFQVREDVFCQYCLAFAVAVVLMFALQYERPPRQSGMAGRLLYALGACDIPLLGIRNAPLFVFAVIGYIFIHLTFDGGVIPLYG